MAVSNIELRKYAASHVKNLSEEEEAESWIEVKKTVYRFYVRDPRAKNTFREFDRIMGMNQLGHVL